MSRVVDYIFDFLGNEGDITFPASWLTEADDVLLREGVVFYRNEPLREIDCPCGCGERRRVQPDLPVTAKVTRVVYCNMASERIILDERQYFTCGVNRQRFMVFAAKGGFEPLTDRISRTLITPRLSRTTESAQTVEIGDASIAKIGKAVAAENLIASQRKKRTAKRKPRTEVDSVVLKKRDDAKRVIAEIKRLYKQGYSYMKAIDFMSKNPVWKMRMASRRKESWKSACMPSRNKQ